VPNIPLFLIASSIAGKNASIISYLKSGVPTAKFPMQAFLELRAKIFVLSTSIFEYHSI